MKLIVGLGNPGHIYALNRHNAGFACLNHLAKSQGIHLDKKRGQARIGLGKVANHEVVLARPQTSMNLSGQSVIRLVSAFKISLDDLVVIHDDLDLVLGKIRIRQGGGSAGHRGINSIVAGLGTPDFLRIRVGIGRPVGEGISVGGKETEVIDHVLGDFTAKERQTIIQVIPRVGEAVLCLLNEGLTAAMNMYNRG